MNSPDKLETYKNSLLVLHDIAPSDIEAKLKANYKMNPDWQEDFEFYKCQCEVPQVGSLGARDQVLERRLRKKEAKEEVKLDQKA